MLIRTRLLGSLSRKAFPVVQGLIQRRSLQWITKGQDAFPKQQNVEALTVAKAPLEVYKKNALQYFRKQHELFVAAYGEKSVGHSPLEAWMHTFYCKPHPELLPAVMLEIARTPGALTGPNALSFITFFSHLFVKFCQNSRDAEEVLEMYYTALAVDLPEDYNKDPLQSRPYAPEQLDSLLRAFWLADKPHFDEMLLQSSKKWVDNVDHMRITEKRKEDLRIFAQSLAPPTTENARTHIVNWPIPCINLAAFEKALKESPICMYGASHYWLSRTYSLYVLNKYGRTRNETEDSIKNTADFSLLSPRLATDITCAMVDAFWACYYATGDRLPIQRVMDVGTLYWEFQEEYGDKYVSERESSHRTPPEELMDDPYMLMKFECSRYALWTFLNHAGLHTGVSDAFGGMYSELNNKASMFDPLGNLGIMTAFGRRQLDLMHVLFPAMQRMSSLSWKSGIGSGKWPESYALLDSPKLLDDLKAIQDAKLIESSSSSSHHHDSPATGVTTNSLDIVQRKVPVSKSSIIDSSSRDRKKVRLGTRSSRIHGVG